MTRSKAKQAPSVARVVARQAAKIELVLSIGVATGYAAAEVIDRTGGDLNWIVMVGMAAGYAAVCVGDWLDAKADA